MSDLPEHIESIAELMSAYGLTRVVTGDLTIERPSDPPGGESLFPIEPPDPEDPLDDLYAHTGARPVNLRELRNKG